MDFATALVRDIAVQQPGATAVFRRHKINFCRHGDVPLAQAAVQGGVDIAQLEAELGVLHQGPTAPVQMDTPELIAHILERYHEIHRQELPEAIRLALRVERRHADHPRSPRGLADLLADIADDLEAHQQKEEVVLFPMLLAGGGPAIQFPIARMNLDHDELDEQLAALAAITHDFTPPADACASWQALFNLCRKLDADLREHLHLENNVLFPASPEGGLGSVASDLRSW